MATYPVNPNLSQGIGSTPVNVTNYNTIIDNLNAIGLDLVTARGDSQAFPGTDHSAGQATNIDDALQAIRHILADITGETNWYDAVSTDLSSINTSLAALGTMSIQDADAINITGGTISGVAIDNLTSLTVTNLTSSNVSITGGSITGITDLAVADGGTGTSTGSITPVGNYTITQNSVAVVTSEAASAVVNTLYLKAGRIGINVIAPAATIDVNGYTDTTAYIVGRFSSNVSGYGSYLSFSDSFTYNFGIGTATNGDFSFNSALYPGSAGTERMRITQTGKLGFSEADPVTMLEATSTAPYFTFHNSTEEDGAGGRESQIIARGEQSGGEETILGMLEFSHDGAADDEKGKLVIKVNDVNDGTSPTTAVTIDSTGLVTFANSTKVATGGGAGKYWKSDATGVGSWSTFPGSSGGYAGIFDVTAYGATGDGVTDDTDAIQDAIDAAADYYNGGIVYFPAGKYKIGAGVLHTKLTIDRRVIIQGCGTGSQIFQSIDEHLFYIVPYAGNACNGMVIRDIFLGSAATTAGKALIYIDGASGYGLAIFENIWMLGGYYGINMTAVHLCTFQNIYANSYEAAFFGATSNNRAWIYVYDADGTDVCNGNTFIDCHLRGANYSFYFDVTLNNNTQIIGGSGETAAGGFTYGIYMKGVTDVLIDRFHNECLTYLTSTAYDWTASASGTNEYYCVLSGGGNPLILQSPTHLALNGSVVGEGVLGSLAAGSWGYGDNDSLGYNTVYVRLSDGTDPDTKTASYVSGYFSKMYFEDCQKVIIRESYTGLVELNHSEYVDIIQCSGGIIADKYSSYVHIKDSRYGANDYLPMTLESYPLETSGINNDSDSVMIPTNRTYNSHRNLVPGDLEVWDTGHPVGFTNEGANNAIAEEGTIVKFGAKSAAVQVGPGGADVHALLQYVLDYGKYGKYKPKTLVNSDYAWCKSGSGTNEYYCTYINDSPELAPALTAGNWTVGAGWESPIVGPGLIKDADGVGTQTPATALDIVVGKHYKVVITLSACTVGSASYTLGGVAGTTLDSAATFTDYIEATTTGSLIITPTNTSRLTISAISILEMADPEIDYEPIGCMLNNAYVTAGTIGSLTAGHWDYDDNDSLGFNTIYVRLSDSTDPDTKAAGYVKIVDKQFIITISAWVYKPETNGANPKIITNYDDGIEGNYVCSVPYDEWTRISHTFPIRVGQTYCNIWIGFYNGATDNLIYVDGIEIVEGDQMSPYYDDSND